MPEVVRYRNKKTQFGIFLIRYRTEMMDADTGVSFLDADAHLWLLARKRWNSNSWGAAPLSMAESPSSIRLQKSHRLAMIADIACSAVRIAVCWPTSA
jgi:hypothetical protein